ncbi:MAG: hypothetical protein GY898_26595 [Proteobacteria bacterium]|nr:hypothetical protein [Pseudomonadota bacterium]
MKLQVTFETGHPAQLEGLDGAVAVVFQDERPLGGVASRADWRLSGFLSRLLMGSKFSGERGEWLLVHTQGRLPYTHLFLVGLGRKDDRTAANSRTALEGIAGKIALAGIHRFAIDLSEVVPKDMAPEDAMVVFLEALSNAYPDDDLADPPFAPAIQATKRNDERLVAARKRRRELQEARARWEAEHASEAAAAVAADEPERPVAGAIPEDLEAEEPAEEQAPPPPDPSSVQEPDLEDTPERTVHVVLLGDAGDVGAMRQSLRDLSGKGDAPLDVAWSK